MQKLRVSTARLFAILQATIDSGMVRKLTIEDDRGGNGDWAVQIDTEDAQPIIKAHTGEEV
jgi:hypothetical protein